MFKSSIVILFISIILNQSLVLCQFPVPLTKGGRNAVHGWLFMPLDQNLPNPENPSQPIQAYFSHHTPEFATDSPHNFQIIILGTVTPLSSGDNITYPIQMNYPPASELVEYEFTFTPPPPFSLNDLLSGDIKQLLGVVFNGSFDTPYERIAESVGVWDILELTTAVYLNDSTAIEPYPYQRYYSYPRLAIGAPIPTDNGVHNFYLAHEIHAVPDFDQVIHATIDISSCSCTDDDNCASDYSTLESIFTPSAIWEFYGIDNNVDNRLTPEYYPSVLGNLLSNTYQNVTCKFEILEQIHCVLGPDFFQIC
ncbi:hypothetical protein DLAC_06662 [Tieghemostelium lacteum]|uniref:Uncharacterized protein n=1 Tax=Tieghemostelium lacteum TaxID=361077 RepID=A0A151ZFG2_TIELA|nr:hypothetical protein DLAC_06662 [Tieghemostelium lacteum]|eukprot:KYQ92667.1 hypothetical protein DLAC_06662 [Tieghemostelium lacteum]